ncbi:hypothetical protein EX30DRAFT_371984 [Ascodesmis nigricans]|uniref:Uncharacterized protein n=1 Tax=Ascodesmis nigricans TaxID=341454 RepID=A0A4S2MVS4_9PEZI|nr:hypothetical protein EX30DRAFT_371984 [Ascodesmis nigricans]
MSSSRSPAPARNDTPADPASAQQSWTGPGPGTAAAPTGSGGGVGGEGGGSGGTSSSSRTAGTHDVSTSSSSSSSSATNNTTVAAVAATASVTPLEQQQHHQQNLQQNHLQQQQQQHHPHAHAHHHRPNGHHRQPSSPSRSLPPQNPHLHHHQQQQQEQQQQHIPSATPGPSTTPGRPPLDPHNNGARAALTNEIRSEFFRLYEQANFQIPGLNPANILRHKDKDLHFEGHDGLRDFWKQTAATRREILQLARENRIQVKRGPNDVQPPPANIPTAVPVPNTMNTVQQTIIPTPQPMILTPDEGSVSSLSPGTAGDAVTPSPAGHSSHNVRKRLATSSSDDGSSTSSYKRVSQSGGFDPEASSSNMAESYRTTKFINTIQAAVAEYQGLNGAGFESQHALQRIAALERERDDALRARDVALGIAEESYRELRAVVESRGRRIRELKDDGGNGND